ncbi:SDR family oxidoreductase [Microbacterium panaciterrae]|uniref:SDR family oxidoreductase n=1 Tax=Microbacterium panaciterrae TaxID=985759 RepID=A0ABP8PI99_9MICO
MAQHGDELEGRVIAITGAGSGLGRAYAVATAQAGAAVVIADLDEVAADAVADEVISAGGRAISVPADISAIGAGERIAEAAVRAFGGLDGFVANAGILSPGRLLAQPDAAVRRTLAVNVDGTIATVVAAARGMREGGSIVVIVSGSMLGAENLALYGTTKAAALGLVYGLSLELGDRGLRVNGLAPRARTGMSAQMGDAGEDKGGPPDGVAPAVIYLLGDLSNPLNGHVLRFDGERLGLFRPPRIEREVAADAWDAASIAAAIAGPLREETRASLPGAAHRTGGSPADVLHVDIAPSSKCLGAEGDG